MPNGFTLQQVGLFESIKEASTKQVASQFDPYRIERPHSSLLSYYLIVSLLGGPFFPILFLPLWIRYSTLRYKFDDEGISMSWGVLFRREVYLTYKRIQDIHLTRNIVQRWMNLATIAIQTASGKSEAEMTIEGILEVEQLRDFLYSRMRGSQDDPQDVPLVADANANRATQALLEIRDAMQTLVARQSTL